MRLLLAALLTLLVYSIRIPIIGGQKRCMVAFVYGNGQTVKLHMKFPKPREEAAGVKWAIAITDTETNQTADYQVNHGHFRQELTTESSVLYEICFWLQGSRQGFYLVGYESTVNFHVKESEIKLPEHLPKNKDVRSTYKTIERISHLGKVREFQTKRNVVQDDKFTRTAELSAQLVTVLRVELLALCALAGLQIFALRKWFQKQHLL